MDDEDVAHRIHSYEATMKDRASCLTHRLSQAAHPAIGEPAPHPPRAYRIPKVCELTGLGRTSIYQRISSGALVAVKCGRATLITEESLRAYLAALPRMMSKAATVGSKLGGDHG